jgi:phospholipid/cholesterol/gamma-HCH transport system substrate-binding protein
VSARNHPRLVGGFVLGAILLVLAAIVFLTSGGWFERRSHFAVFFPGSLSGLNEGAPVTFRGVKVGEVSGVTPFLTGKADEPIQIEVVIELNRNVVEAPEGMVSPYKTTSDAELAKILIQHGIRARLTSVSLLTGQKAIDLDFMPDQPARFAGLSRKYPELPTTPTALEKLGERFEAFSEKLAELPLDQMLEDVRQAISAVRELLQSEDLREAFAGARRSAQELEPLLLDARKGVADLRITLKRVDGETTQTGAELRRTLAEARARAEQLQGTLETVQATVRGGDDARVEATRALDELERALRALRNLADYIQTHPEAVIQGKEKMEERR